MKVARMYRHLLSFVALSACVAVAAAGCPLEPRFCYPGDWRLCEGEDACLNGADGYQQCGEEGNAYGECDCSGFVPGEGATDDDDDDDTSGYGY